MDNRPENMPDDLYAIILAAGESSRFGSAKQLALWENDYLINHTINLVNSIFAEKVIVVLGANAELIKKAAKLESVNVLINNDWQKGLSSSIKTGILNVPKSAKAAMIFLADQPLLEVSSIKKIIATYKKNSDKIVASDYKSNHKITQGVPAIFPIKHFVELMNLEGDVGARNLLKKHQSELLTVAVPEAMLDIDTKQDLENIKI
ncbi:MAG: nucleotidyltransferase family protein [Gammaproteobacteria bacterium]